jgi:hypothetical protein
MTYRIYTIFVLVPASPFWGRFDTPNNLDRGYAGQISASPC